MKFSLRDAHDFERALSLLGSPSWHRTQANHYFGGDPAGLLDSGEAMLRLRISGEKAWLTWKADLVKKGALYHCTEVEVPLSTSQAQSLLDHPEEALDPSLSPGETALEKIGKGSLILLGESTTERTGFRLSQGAVVLADRSRFPGGAEDFELELESDDPAAERELRSILGRGGLVLHPQTATKYARFLNALRRS